MQEFAYGDKLTKFSPNSVVKQINEVLTSHHIWVVLITAVQWTCETGFKMELSYTIYLFKHISIASKQRVTYNIVF